MINQRVRQHVLRKGEPTLPERARITTVKSLRKHLQWAIELEHSTIPPYLCALYSIKEGYNVEAARIIKSVVMEEMLHMVLAANVLNAIGGDPDLTHARFIPKYWTYLPHSDKDFKVHLQKFSKESIETFLKIEHPAGSKAPAEAEKYHTIGQFYEAIELGLIELTHKGMIFTKVEYRHQITPEHYYGGGGAAMPVCNLETAQLALQEIVGQGEGVDSTTMDGDDKFGEIDELAHYFRFNEIHEERKYTRNDSPQTGPRGEKLPVQWDQVYPMQTDPKMANYPKGSDLWRKTHEFSLTYMALLAELQAALRGEPQRMMQSVARMYDLKYQAVELMKIPIADGEMTAGPSFEYVA